jgi:hypothetical protein
MLSSPIPPLAVIRVLGGQRQMAALACGGPSMLTGYLAGKTWNLWLSSFLGEKHEISLWQRYR